MQQNEDPARRVPVNGASGLVLAFDSAANEVPMPKGLGLTRRHARIWESIMHSRARAEWKDHDVFTVARICQNVVDLRQLRKELRRDKFVQVGEGGRKVSHPLMAVTAKLASEIRQDLRMLGMSARQLNGSSSDFEPLRRAERQARQKVEHPSDKQRLLA